MVLGSLAIRVDGWARVSILLLGGIYVLDAIVALKSEPKDAGQTRKRPRFWKYGSEEVFAIWFQLITVTLLLFWTTLTPAAVPLAAMPWLTSREWQQVARTSSIEQTKDSHFWGTTSKPSLKIPGIVACFSLISSTVIVSSFGRTWLSTWNVASTDAVMLLWSTVDELAKIWSIRLIAIFRGFFHKIP